MKASLTVNGYTMTGNAVLTENSAFIKFTSDDGIFEGMFRKEFCTLDIEAL